MLGAVADREDICNPVRLKGSPSSPDTSRYSPRRRLPAG